jgi:hypothetical protein
MHGGILGGVARSCIILKPAHNGRGAAAAMMSTAALTETVAALASEG